MICRSRDYPPGVATSAPRAVVVALLYLAVLLAAALTSAPRRVGDGGEYFVMATRLAAMQSPALTRAELDTTRSQLTALGSGFESALIEYPNLVGPDGRQDFLHFWLYPLLAAPMVPVARALDLHPNWAFTFTNLLLLVAAVFVLARHVPVVAIVAGFISPILWWADKAHAEAFLFAAVSMAAAIFERAPATAVIVFAFAGAQNAALGITFPMFALCALVQANGQRRAWISAAVGAGIVSSPFVYTWTRLGRLSPMAEYAELAWPSFNLLTAFVAEPNIGLVVNAPVYALAVVAAMRLAVLSFGGGRAGAHPARARQLGHLCPAITQATLLVIWSQNPNINHGGTPGVNRWVLSLLALSLPWIGSAYLTVSGLAQRVVVTLIIATAAWSAAQHLPSRPEEYLRPTPVAELMWRAGWLHLTPAEVFAERTQHREPPSVPSHDGRCSVVLMADLQWPLQCAPPDEEMPRECHRSSSMCYAIAWGSQTRFLPASFNGFFYIPAVPSWPATGPLAGAVRALLSELDAGSREWRVESARRWIESARNVDVQAVLLRNMTLFLYISRTGDDPELRLLAPGFATASLHTLIPVSTLGRLAESDARFVLHPPSRATNLAVTLTSTASSRPTP